MGLFDFLKDLGGGMNLGEQSLAPLQAGATVSGGMSPVPGKVADNGLLQAPQMAEKPGLLTRLRTPDANGVTFGDKLSAAGGLMAGDDNPTARIDALRKQGKVDADRKRRNEAFRAAYKNGKFDPGAYMDALGSADFDPSDLASLEKAFNRPAESQYMEGTDGIYQIDKASGQTRKVQGYQPKANTTPGQVDPETGRWEWAPGYLDAVGAKSGVQRKAIVDRPMPSRARPRAGGATWLPPGAKIVHLPGQ